MYSGFVSRKRVVKKLGIHQKFDSAAYRMVEPFLRQDSFPTEEQILHFEGLNGPDGLKIKSPGEAEPSHLYDPVNDTGEVPSHIENHYQQLVKALKSQDLIRAAFEASWLAHYVCDGLTPAHNFPLEEELHKLKQDSLNVKPGSFSAKGFLYDHTVRGTLRKNWALWGKGGLLSTHFNFEMGVATTLLLSPIRGKLDPAKLVQARQIGALEFFKQEARAIAALNLYEIFSVTGWSSKMAAAIRGQLAPRTAQTIGVIWLLAYLEADLQLLREQAHAATKRKGGR
jgi:hypothetical protein